MFNTLGEQINVELTGFWEPRVLAGPPRQSPSSKTSLGNPGFGDTQSADHYHTSGSPLI